MDKKIILLLIIFSAPLSIKASDHYTIQKTPLLKREAGKDYNLELHNKTKNSYGVSFIYRQNTTQTPEPHSTIDGNEYIRIAGFDIKKGIGVALYQHGLYPVAGFYIKPNKDREALYLKLETDLFGDLILKPQNGKEYGSKSGRSLYKNVKENEIKRVKTQKNKDQV